MRPSAAFVVVVVFLLACGATHAEKCNAACQKIRDGCPMYFHYQPFCYGNSVSQANFTDNCQLSAAQCQEPDAFKDYKRLKNSGCSPPVAPIVDIVPSAPCIPQ